MGLVLLLLIPAAASAGVLWMHRFEVAAWLHSPWGFALLAFDAVILLLGLGVAVAHAITRRKKAHELRLRWAYERARLLRVVQSPVWFAVPALALGLAVAQIAVLRVPPTAWHWALYADFQGRPPAEKRRMAERAMQAARSLQEAGKIPILSLAEPFPVAADDAENLALGREAANKTLPLAGFGLGLAWLGIGAVVALWKREALGPSAKGRSALAARSEVVFDPSGYWSLPLQVDQAGRRDFSRVDRAPYTVARPPVTTFAVHIVVFGNSGSGKGAYFGGHVFETCVTPIVYFDFKGEMPAYRLRPQMLRWGFPGQRPKGLPSLRFNFVDWARNHEDPDTAAKALAAAILPQNSQKPGDNAWIKDTAVPILAAGFLVGRWANLAELADEVEHTPLPEILDNIEIGRGRMASMAGKNVPEYAQNEISNNTLAFLSGRARHMATASDFSMDGAFERGLYVMGQSASVYERRVLSLFWGIFWFELLRKGTPMPLTVFVDEGIAAGPIPRVEDALVTLRDRDISLIQCFQTRAGLTSVYGRDLAESVYEAHQTHIYLTKGLSDADIHAISKLAGTFTVKPEKAGQLPQERPLLPPDELKRHCRQQKFWAYIEGVQWTSTGRPILAQLVPIRHGGWNWRATAEEYDAELARVEAGQEWPSPFKMVRGEELTIEKDKKTVRLVQWVPAFPEAAAQKGVTRKLVPLVDRSQVLENLVADLVGRAADGVAEEAEVSELGI